MTTYQERVSLTVRCSGIRININITTEPSYSLSCCLSVCQRLLCWRMGKTKGWDCGIWRKPVKSQSCPNTDERVWEKESEREPRPYQRSTSHACCLWRWNAHACTHTHKQSSWQKSCRSRTDLIWSSQDWDRIDWLTCGWIGFWMVLSDGFSMFILSSSANALSWFRLLICFYFGKVLQAITNHNNNSGNR